MRALNLLLSVLFQTLRALWRVHSDLILENLAIRRLHHRYVRREATYAGTVPRMSFGEPQVDHFPGPRKHLSRA